MTQTQQPEALQLAHALGGGKLIDDSTEWADTLHAAAAELRRQHTRISELEKYESNLIDQRDHCEEIINRMADAVLGEDRPEWSSAYDFTDAAQDVDAHIDELKTKEVHTDSEQRNAIAKLLGLGEANFAWSYLHDQIKDLVKCEKELIALRKQAVRRAPAAPVPQWVRPVSELLGHISDVLPNSAFNKIDTAKWNAVSALVGATTQAAAQGMGAQDAARYQALVESGSFAPSPFDNGMWGLRVNSVPSTKAELDAAVDRVIAAQAKQGGA